MDPEELAVKYVRDADALASAKRHDEAVALYDLAIGVDPDCTEAPRRRKERRRGTLAFCP